ncbi:hypothetical protein HHK36_012189 [Tetracentron sinense]|uniref:DNA (cytosine-5-)-methyltransferase n=1 Tax=Tetracentron sinense TaxID=13715 RepID=A0A834ZEY4_TETSI|nr:hypothetical protein HHK36_012189 [Tetracentron sinense]
MDKAVDYADSESSSDQEGETGTMSKFGALGLDLPSESGCSNHIGGSVASSSEGNVKPYLIGMGFPPPLVDKVIRENGEDNIDLLLETLFSYSAPQKSNSESSDSLDGLFSDSKDENSALEFAADSQAIEVTCLCLACDIQKSNSESSDSLDGLFSDSKDASNPPDFSADSRAIEELGVPTVFNEDKRASLLMMNFSVDEVEFAIDKLGEDALVHELVDLIIAAQTAESSDKDMNDPVHGDEVKNEEISTEALFGTMEKTLRLLEMGFSDHEISSAIEKFGSEVPISELADSIFANQIASTCAANNKDPSTLLNMHCSRSENDWRSLGMETEERVKHRSFVIPKVENQASISNSVPRARDIDFENILKGKKPKLEYMDDSSEIDFDKILKGKKPKLEYMDDSSTFLGPTWQEARTVEPKFTSYQMPLPHRELHGLPRKQLDRLKMPHLPKPDPCKSIYRMVAKPPYFFYGNVVDVSHDSWTKISQFLYALEPEYANTQFFSALSRKEGYIHNLPTDSRSHILPRPPMTIEDAIPHTKKWWPSWDTRKQLSCISMETMGISQLCERLGKILVDSQGMLSTEQQRDILHHCKTLNLVWVGPSKLSPIEPDHVERILGYPLHHTRVAECNLMERLRSLKHCFQTDTLGYHLSVLKRTFPEGVTMLSLYSGVGGAEVALHRLGIRLKVVVSVEASETKRKILKMWWRNTGQTGELVQIEDIQRLTINKLEGMIKGFGGFDFVICQNPCTYSSGSSKLAAAASDNPSGLDFPLFYEFVRVLQRVRSTMGRSR